MICCGMGGRGKGFFYLSAEDQSIVGEYAEEGVPCPFYV